MLATNNWHFIKLLLVASVRFVMFISSRREGTCGPYLLKLKYMGFLGVILNKMEAASRDCHKVLYNFPLTVQCLENECM